MANNTPKLRAVAVREIKFARPSKVDHLKASAALSSFEISGVDELSSQPDLLHVEAVLVSEGINDNDDAFTREELKRAISSPILKPMNWQHKDDQILGAMYAVEARDLQGKTLAAEEIEDQEIELVIQGVVWHHLPHIKATAEQIVQRIEKGDLFVSMECWFDDYDYGLYTQGGELFDSIARKPETAFLDGHLRVCGGTGKYNGMRIGRALSGVTFGGVAFVDRPANKRSFILNHFAFDPLAEAEVVEASSDPLIQDQEVTQTTLFSKKEPMEVNMNDLNRAAASAEEIQKGVQLALDAQKRIEASERTVSDLQKATASNAQLESDLATAKAALDTLRSAIDRAYSGATNDTPAEIAKIDKALDVKGEGAGDAVFAAKIAWIADSRKAVASALVENKDLEADTKLIEENTALKAELTTIKQDLRKHEIEYLFATVLEMGEDKVNKFVEVGLSKASDEAYAEWLDEKKVFAKEMIELKKKGKKDKKAPDAEAGLLETMDRETPIADEGAVLRPELGRAPTDMPRVPRSKLGASADLNAMFEEVNEPNLAGASAEQEGGNGESPMGRLVANLIPAKNTKKEV
tara:strand:- start:122829 stop:124568 length:1740 start_codon:yes stop_codon:yes gene_type:complete